MTKKEILLNKNRGYTEIPDSLFDKWIFILSPTQFKILFVLCEEFFRFHNTNGLSATDISIRTSLSIPTSRSSVEKLCTLKVAKKIQGERSVRYVLNNIVFKKPEGESHE